MASFQNFAFQAQSPGNQIPAQSNPTGPSISTPTSNMSIPVPSSREELQHLYVRWQTIKQQQGENAPNDPEFVEISKTLRAFSRQQELFKERMQQQQQQQQQQHQLQQQQQHQQLQQQQQHLQPQQPQAPNQSQNPSSNQHQRDQMFGYSSPSQAPQISQMSNGASPQNTVRPPSANGSSPVSNLFTPDQLVMLKTQIFAFKNLTKNLPIHPQLYSILFKGRQEQQQQQQSQLLQRNNLSPTTNHTQSVGPTTPVVIPSEAKSAFEKLGVKGYVKISNNRIGEFAPSILPYGLDVVDMKLQREGEIVDQISDRIKELKALESQGTASEDDIIELRQLELIPYQKALRGDLLTWAIYFNQTGIDDTNKHMFTRLKTLTMAEANAVENFALQQRSERLKRENQKKIETMTHICQHSAEVMNNRNQLKSKRIKLGQSARSYHSFVEKEEQKRIERTAKQRLQALKANDEEAYIKLLDQTKDTRITHLLRQTNSFLDSLASAVKDQQRVSRGLNNEVEEPEVANENEEKDGEKIDYFAVAHRVQEEVTKQPSMLVGGTLKEYQIKGLQWMVSLFNNNLNGILADEMGLGKTIQSISLITYLIETKRLPGPYLVIVPLSTLTNWTLEFERWAPGVKKIVYKGPPLARKAQQAAIRSGDFQVLLTTYEYIIKDRPLLSRIKWIHMIIDEGHRMKNSQSKLSYTLTTYYSSRYRLILTGTPLQNNLPELWALLNFVLPKIFNSVKSFDEWFNTPFANTGGQDKMDLSEEETLLIIRRLHKVLRPFLLRRLKKDVEKDLPDKVEKVVKCKMSALQQKLYHQMIQHKVIFLGQDANGAGKGGLKGLNNQIMQLRKICNHPFVFEEVENLVNPSKSTNDLLWRSAGKFELLDRVLAKFKATGHRVLIFFQMTQIMDIMEDFLRLRGLLYLRLDGATKAEDRSELLKLFNAPDSPYFAFLLSTRAGGLGLNLQTADTVIIYDTDWNPHQDLQAQDRAHRIGQTKEVRILRLITENSVEENILERAHHKLDIDGKVIQAGKFDNKSTSEEQEAFLRSLLEAEDSKKLHKEESDEEDIDDEELNDILARNDGEKEIFRKLDAERIAQAKAAGLGDVSRLLTEDELPEQYKNDEFLDSLMNQQEDPVPVDEFGRHQRPRKQMRYDDLLTEEQWLDAVDNDDDTIEEAIARKRAKLERRQAKKHAKTGYFDGESPDGAGEVESPMDSGTPDGSFSRKRRRRTKAEVVGSLASTASTPASVVSTGPISAPPFKKRAKGRPPKIPETLTPDERAKLQSTLNRTFDTINSLVEEGTDRPIAGLFQKVPSKRLYPDYYVLIKDPIAMDMIQKKMARHAYQSIAEFKADFDLMFRNARTYNEEGSFVYEDANLMEKCLKKELGLPAEESEDDNDASDSDAKGSGPGHDAAFVLSAPPAEDATRGAPGASTEPVSVNESELHNGIQAGSIADSGQNHNDDEKDDVGDGGDSLHIDGNVDDSSLMPELGDVFDVNFDDSNFVNYD